ncbi:phosphoribosylanthranilate isomerase [Nisaea acidiphila]|uniref:N-(5'-phosphoribosyl)anthranilate isomerase n=1 Tax=Nisaea acidiphila TaxID=1862145 RepID=A0A9J7AZB8_9PROT|nr:phosphoribosylanthranilate isomerase [Nisaea acidiphila]UUX51769.1 phosphoribosylanthranilate isomerase [Nisaea acidiphila]
MDVKICGLKTPDSVEAAAAAGATHLGFNFFAPSPRAVTPAEARLLARHVPAGVKIVALVVDADDALLEEIWEHLHPDIFQLHGKETPERVREIKARFGVEVMKVVRVAEAADARSAEAYDGVADLLLFDAKPPKDKDKLPGGNGLIFDWTALQAYRGKTPWMLAGGLDAANVAEAIRVTGTGAVDTASGAEDAPGVKSPEKIRKFVAAALGKA